MTTWNNDIRQRMAALDASLRTALPKRIIKRGLQHFDAHTPAELCCGVLMLISDSETDFNPSMGMPAKSGTHKIIVVGHCKTDEMACPSELEIAEMDLIEDLKAWIRQPPAGMDLLPEQFQQSRQLEFPYGWITAFIDVVPPRNNVY